DAEVIEVVAGDLRRGGGVHQVGGVDRHDLRVPAAGDAEHVQREDQGVVVVAKVAGVVGVEAALGGGDLVKDPVRAGQGRRVAGPRDGQVEGADVGAEVHVLVADDETADLLVVGDDGVGELGAGVGAGQAAGGEKEVRQAVGDRAGTGALVGVEGDRLV